ncbi:MAG: hypothetical protein Q8K22_00440 [Rhodoferax sp.]|nr:hypothetical protein [Rhodoferax sp.]
MTADALNRGFTTLTPRVLPFVRGNEATLSLHFNLGTIQSRMVRQKPFDLDLPYTRTMMGFLLFLPQPTHILMIGLGGGSLAKFCYRNLPETRMTVVEIDPLVVAMRQQFLIPGDDARLSVVCADGAAFVRDAKPEFDVILVDGFDAGGQSDALTTQAFYDHCHQCLSGHSLMVVNLDKGHPDHACFVQRIRQTYADQVLILDVDERDNCIVLAGKGVSLAASDMNLSAALGHHRPDVQSQLKGEFERILRVLHKLEPLATEPGLRFPQLTL